MSTQEQLRFSCVRNRVTVTVPRFSFFTFGPLTSPMSSRNFSACTHSQITALCVIYSGCLPSENVRLQTKGSITMTVCPLDARWRKAVCWMSNHLGATFFYELVFPPGYSATGPSSLPPLQQVKSFNIRSHMVSKDKDPTTWAFSSACCGTAIHPSDCCGPEQWPCEYIGNCCPAVQQPRQHQICRQIRSHCLSFSETYFSNTPCDF